VGWAHILMCECDARFVVFTDELILRKVNYVKSYALTFRFVCVMPQFWGPAD